MSENPKADTFFEELRDAVPADVKEALGIATFDKLILLYAKHYEAQQSMADTVWDRDARAFTRKYIGMNPVADAVARGAAAADELKRLRDYRLALREDAPEPKDDGERKP